MQALEAALSIFRTAGAFLLVITILVAVHELGHYWVARLCGMKVDAFAVMMGGIRKTDLKPWLEKPLAPAWMPWSLALVGGLLMLFGGVENWQPMLIAGLAVFAVILPVWVAGRLQALYHLPNGQGYTWVAIGWAAGFGLLAFSSRFQGLQIVNVLALMAAGGLCAAMLLYYVPVLTRADEAGMVEETKGQGAIKASGETVPVRFRPLLARTDKHGTEFSLLLLPLGGFAAIRGMHPREDGSEVNIPGGFYSKSPLARLAALFAGPFFSIAFGVLLLTGLILKLGEASEQPVVGQVNKDSAAAAAGMKPNDRVISIDGVAIGKWPQIAEALKGKADQPLSVVIERDGSRQTLAVTPKLSAEEIPVLDKEGQPTGKRERRAQLGIMASTQPVSLGKAFMIAAKAPVAMVTDLGKMIGAGRGQEAIGGPVTIVRVTTNATDDGWTGILQLAALLSISLGIMNLLPIPPLDGGQMVVAFVEMLRGGKRLSLQVQHAVSAVGMFLVLALMLGAMAVDIGRVTKQPEPPKVEAPAKAPADPDKQP